MTEDHDAGSLLSSLPRGQDIFDVCEIAGFFKVNDDTVRRWITDGWMHATKIVGKWKISRKDIADLIGEPPPRRKRRTNVR